VRDSKSKCFLLIIRGATTTTDRLTAATGAEVPFHHVILNNGKVENLVLGRAHCGMLASARWISQLAIPCLHEELARCSDYEVKVSTINSVAVVTIFVEFKLIFATSLPHL
jgi:hypothetical protein